MQITKNTSQSQSILQLMAIALYLTSFINAKAKEPSSNVTESAIEKIACGACYRPTSKNANIWNTISKWEPQAFLFMGDNIYADTEDMQVMKYKYNQLLTLPSYKEFAASVTILPTWDDHDYGANDAGAEYPQKVEAQSLFLDTFGFPDDHPARSQEGIYNSYSQGPDGKRVQIINLDTRYHRSALKQETINGNKTYLPLQEKNATMLGETQWKWLELQLKQPADLRLIVSSIQIITESHRFEKWSNIPAERTRFFQLLKSTGAKNTILLSGDRHLAEFTMIKPEESGLNYDLVELTSSGLTHAGAPYCKNPHRILKSYYRGKNFGTIEIDWEKPSSPKVTLSIQTLSLEGHQPFKQKVIQF